MRRNTDRCWIRRIVGRIVSDGRLDARRQRWLPDVEARLAALGG